MSRRGYHAVAGQLPPISDQCEYWLSIAQIAALQRNGPEWKFYLARSLQELLAHPAHVFRGLRREGYDNGYGLAAIPSTVWKSDTIQLPPRPGFTLLCTVSKDLTILDWEFRKSTGLASACPQHWEQDFEEQIWPIT